MVWSRFIIYPDHAYTVYRCRCPDTQSDVAIAGLKHAQQTLQRQIRDAEQTIVRKMEEVRGYVRKNAKNIAVIHLKQVKQLEKQLLQRSDMLGNLDTLMMHIGM